MFTYNTTLHKIQLPEYGRNLENLINYCKSIPDKDKRTRFAHGIVQIMARIKEDECTSEDQLQIYWDHLALLSNFELDIDYPYEIIKKEKLEVKPSPIIKTFSRIKYRQYGLIVERMITEAKYTSDKEKRVRLLELCANQMKLHFHLANVDAEEDDEKIIHDLMEYVGRDFVEDCKKVTLYSINELKENLQYELTPVAAAPTKKKKKKKKKKSS